MSDDIMRDTNRTMGIIAGFVLVIIVAGLLIQSFYGTEATLSKRGQEVSATITNLSIDSDDPRTGYDKKADLAFVWKGTEYRVVQPVDQAFLDEKNKGEQVILCVNPDNINTVRLSFPSCANKLQKP